MARRWIASSASSSPIRFFAAANSAFSSSHAVLLQTAASESNNPTPPKPGHTITSRATELQASLGRFEHRDGGVVSLECSPVMSKWREACLDPRHRACAAPREAARTWHTGPYPDGRTVHVSERLDDENAPPNRAVLERVVGSCASRDMGAPDRCILVVGGLVEASVVGTAHALRRGRLSGPVRCVVRQHRRLQWR